MICAGDEADDFALEDKSITHLTANLLSNASAVCIQQSDGVGMPSMAT